MRARETIAQLFLSPKRAPQLPPASPLTGSGGRAIQHRISRRIVFHGVAPAENQLLSAVCRELRQTGATKISISSPFPEFLFKSNVAALLSPSMG